MNGIRHASGGLLISGLALLTTAGASCRHSSFVDRPTLRQQAEFVTCDWTDKAHIGSEPMTEAAVARTWLQANREVMANGLREDCLAKATHFIETTDFARWQLLISSGYSAAEPASEFDDNHTTVTLFRGQVCGGAYPTSQLTLLRLPAGRTIASKTTGGLCPANLP